MKKITADKAELGKHYIMYQDGEAIAVHAGPDNNGNMAWMTSGEIYGKRVDTGGNRQQEDMRDIVSPKQCIAIESER